MSKRFKVRLSDSLTIEPIEMPEANKKLLQDAAYVSSNSPLMIKIAATHSGIITRNNGFYMPDKMNDGAVTFVQNYNKPVLLHHNSHDGDPVGRVVHAAYVNTSTGIAKNDSYLKDFVDPHTSFETKVDLIDRIINDGMLDDPTYEGVGYIELTASITDQNAIQKIADNRYLTVSIGAETDAAVCSICKEDWAETGEMCDHVPGEVYDGKPAFVIAGNLFYDEISFVSTPADPHAKIIQISGADGGFQDNKSIAGEEHIVDHAPTVVLDMYLEKGDKKYDMLRDSVADIMKIKDNKKEEKEPMKKKLVEDASNVDMDKLVADSLARIVAANESVAGINDYAEFAIGTHLSTIEDEKLGEVEEEVFDAAVIELINFIKSVVDADDESLSKMKTEDAESKLGLIEDIESKFRSSDDDGATGDDPVSDIQTLDPIAVFNAVEESMDALELSDSKVDPAKRKALSKTAFCVSADKKVEGIKGYFPVPNMDYVTATRKYLEDSTLTDELKAEIGKTLDRKEKIYVGDKKEPTGTKVADIMSMTDEALKELGKKVFDQMKTKDLLDECAGCDENESVISGLEDKLIEANDQLAALRIELKEAFKDSAEVNVLHADLLDQYTELASKVIVDFAALKGGDEIKIDDLKKKSASELSDEFNSISDGLDFSILAGKINDGTSHTPEGTVNDPTLQHKEDEFKAETIKSVAENYTSILFSKGGIAAAAYLDDCKAKKLIPADLDAFK